MAYITGHVRVGRAGTMHAGGHRVRLAGMDDSGPEQGVLHLSRNDAAILAAALRQYQPYWRPEDPDHGEELNALVRDIMRLLAELRAQAPAGHPGLLGDLQAE